jgi:hypothetical protein
LFIFGLRLPLNQTGMTNTIPRPFVNRGNAATIYMALTALLGWFGLIAQLYLVLTDHEAGRTIPGVLVQFISYFTVICNLLVSISLTAILLNPSPKSFFSRNTILMAIALYILIVGIVFNTVLRYLLALTGLAFWVNEIMHVFIPALYTIFWIWLVPKGGLHWNSFLPWLWVPFLYLVYVLIRGAVCGLYPYPFMDAGKYGYGHVALSSFIIMLAFVGFGLLLIWVARLMTKKSVN